MTGGRRVSITVSNMTAQKEYYRHLSLCLCDQVMPFLLCYALLISVLETELDVNKYFQSSQADLPTLIADRIRFFGLHASKYHE